MNIIICTIKSWNVERAMRLQEKRKELDNIYIVSEKDELEELVKKVTPDYIFFPHWSYIIPSMIFKNYNCIVFHMTDLPYGRGGSPLQNLIVRGKKDTKISAIKVNGEIDAGPIYLKEELSLEGNAEEIFVRAAEIIFTKMIPQILDNNIKPIDQVGEVVHFKRRKPKDGEITSNFSVEKIYDYIRMLDAEGYPKAFIKFGAKRIEFSSAKFIDGKLYAKVEFVEDNGDE